MCIRDRLLLARAKGEVSDQRTNLQPMSLHQGSPAVSDSMSVLRPARAPLTHWEGKSKGDGTGRDGTGRREREFLGTFSSCLVAFPPSLHTPVTMPSVLSSKPREREREREREKGADSPRSVQPTEQVVGSGGSHTARSKPVRVLPVRGGPRGVLTVFVNTSDRKLLLRAEASITATHPRTFLFCIFGSVWLGDGEVLLNVLRCQLTY